MPGTEPTSARNPDGSGAPQIQSARVRDVPDGELTQAPGSGGPGRRTPWLTTVNPDGSAHVMPVGVSSVNGAWHFNPGPGTRKSRTLGRDARCVLVVATRPFALVVEGTAERVTDAAALHSVAERCHPGLAGPGGRRRPDRRVQRPSRRPPPWTVYRIAPTTVSALGTANPYGATRFDLRTPSAERPTPSKVQQREATGDAR